MNYRTEESDGKITILADMTPILEKSESYTAVAAQYNSYGVLVDCRIFKSSDLENAASFEKTIDEKGDYTENVEFTPTDKKPFSWVQTREVRLSGQLCVTWYYNHMEESFDNEKGTVKTPSTQTVAQGNKCAVNLVNHPEDRAHFYYYNVFEEIDMPGEWCSSDAEKRIYINLENEPSATDEIKICSQSTDKLFDISDSRDVVFDGIEFENARSVASVTGSERVVFKNCRFENIIKTAVTLNCCEFSGVLSSEFKNVSGGVGIVDNRNNIINLKAERNFVQNCHFNKVSGSCITISTSCGNIISHNLAENYNGSYLGIFGGCENVFEYNESASGGFNGNEANIVYIDGCYQARYNHIRYNYIHDNSPDPKKILLGCGVVVDDMGESNLVYGNILEAVWKDIDNATGYRLTVSDKADMSNVVYEKPLIENRAQQEVQIYSDKDVTYYYQISALITSKNEDFCNCNRPHFSV